ncbi:DUF202 domain-containing protein [Aspergillus glaucus CBS 516.65]|uniref:DUF202 domain-containing protein n=1 Tax=Aspergillus glaucus CBS 516.65 TaxID=1160497 RepID=A0A1L9VWF6_ASPGL|nr:hypothetical protein ASPGLDRAFT_41777 [Aspergillus glaucus CBS 516.65]OJJ88253.1 hypothetical protein ASPGLDRAFT_41777 [Aspergillus glaucus CBS 516.65]
MTDPEDPDPLKTPYNPLINLFNSRPVLVDEIYHYPENPNANDTINDDENDPPKKHIFLTTPLTSPLLFKNTTSDARDHCANERTFLSWLRLSMYLAIVSSAIIISFHFRSPPTKLEKHMALPLGLVFWVLSLACLANGLANYVRTVWKYSRRAALVQSGWKTQMIVGIVGGVILGCCVLFLVTDAKTQ